MNRAISRATWAAATALILTIPVQTGRAEEAKPVTVVNPPSAPVPVAVQGTTAIAGQVQVTNEPVVRLRNPTVTVDNVVAVKPIEGVPSERFHAGRELFVDSQPGALPDPDWRVLVPQVPAGKVLVIDQVSAKAFSTPKTVPEIVVHVFHNTVPPTETFHFIALHDTGPVADDDRSYSATHSLKLYAFAGEAVSIEMRTVKAGSDGNIYAVVSLSGYFLPAE